MKWPEGFEFPAEKRKAYHRARRLEWVTLVYLATVVVLLYFVMGSSQAMKTAWVEDLLSLIAPAAFLIAAPIALRKPTERFPYGFHRAISIAFLCAAAALFTMGAWLLVDAIIKLAEAHHPTIGSVTIFGVTFWHGWLMLAALLYSGLPPIFLGRAKLPLAKQIHDKVLHTDADMNKADWMTASAAMLGVIGIGLGFWWADAVAAAVISISVIHDGFNNLRRVICDLLNEMPSAVDGSRRDPLPERVRQFLLEKPWIKDAVVRMREDGHAYFGEALIVPADRSDLAHQLTATARELKKLDWKLHDIVLAPVTSLDDEEQDTGESRA